MMVETEGTEQGGENGTFDDVSISSTSKIVSGRSDSAITQEGHEATVTCSRHCRYEIIAKILIELFCLAILVSVVWIKQDVVETRRIFGQEQVDFTQIQDKLAHAIRDASRESLKANHDRLQAHQFAVQAAQLEKEARDDQMEAKQDRNDSLSLKSKSLLDENTAKEEVKEAHHYREVALEDRQASQEDLATSIRYDQRSQAIAVASVVVSFIPGVDDIFWIVGGVAAVSLNILSTQAADAAAREALEAEWAQNNATAHEHKAKLLQDQAIQEERESWDASLEAEVLDHKADSLLQEAVKKELQSQVAMDHSLKESALAKALQKQVDALKRQVKSRYQELTALQDKVAGLVSVAQGLAILVLLALLVQQVTVTVQSWRLDRMNHLGNGDNDRKEGVKFTPSGILMVAQSFLLLILTITWFSVTGHMGTAVNSATIASAHHHFLGRRIVLMSFIALLMQLALIGFLVRMIVSTRSNHADDPARTSGISLTPRSITIKFVVWIVMKIYMANLLVLVLLHVIFGVSLDAYLSRHQVTLTINGIALVMIVFFLLIVLEGGGRDLLHALRRQNKNWPHYHYNDPEHIPLVIKPQQQEQKVWMQNNGFHAHSTSCGASAQEQETSNTSTDISGRLEYRIVGCNMFTNKLVLHLWHVLILVVMYHVLVSFAKLNVEINE